MKSSRVITRWTRPLVSRSNPQNGSGTPRRSGWMRGPNTQLIHCDDGSFPGRGRTPFAMPAPGRSHCGESPGTSTRGCIPCCHPVSPFGGREASSFCPRHYERALGGKRPTQAATTLNVPGYVVQRHDSSSLEWRPHAPRERRKALMGFVIALPQNKRARNGKLQEAAVGTATRDIPV